jgi:hypothetical protein
MYFNIVFALSFIVLGIYSFVSSDVAAQAVSLLGLFLVTRDLEEQVKQSEKKCCGTGCCSDEKKE